MSKIKERSDQRSSRNKTSIRIDFSFFITDFMNYAYEEAKLNDSDPLPECEGEYLFTADRATVLYLFVSKLFKTKLSTKNSLNQVGSSLRSPCNNSLNDDRCLIFFCSYSNTKSRGDDVYFGVYITHYNQARPLKTKIKARIIWK